MRWLRLRWNEDKKNWSLVDRNQQREIIYSVPEGKIGERLENLHKFDFKRDFLNAKFKGRFDEKGRVVIERVDE
jgi:hypothetical protein